LITYDERLLGDVLMVPARTRAFFVWVKELRASFFTATLVPVALGATIAWNMLRVFNATYFILTLTAALCLHAGTNMINDYFDFRSGCDLHPIYKEFWAPFFGGSRLLPEKILNPRDVYIASLLSFGLGGLIGLHLALERGIVIILLGVTGVLSGYFYVTHLATRGVGEFFVSLNFGPLMVFGSYYVQAQTMALKPLVASIPVGLLIASVLLINEIPDYDADKRVGKNTLVVRLGRKRAADVYGMLMFLTYAVILLEVSLSLMPVLTLLSFLTAPLAIRAVYVAKRNYEEPRKLVPANVGTILVHLFTGLLLCVAYVISGYVAGL